MIHEAFTTVLAMSHMESPMSVNTLRLRFDLRSPPLHSRSLPLKNGRVPDYVPFSRASMLCASPLRCLPPNERAVRPSPQTAIPVRYTSLRMAIGHHWRCVRKVPQPTGGAVRRYAH